MSENADRIRSLTDKIRRLELEASELNRQGGKQPLRVAQRSGGGGKLRWKEGVSETPVGRFPSPTDFKPYVEGEDYLTGQENTHRKQNVARQNLTQIRNALIDILDSARTGGLFFAWPPPKTWPINHPHYFNERMRWTYDTELPTFEYLFYPNWATTNRMGLGGGYSPTSPSGVASVKGRTQYANPLSGAEQIEAIIEFLGIAHAQTEEAHGLAVNDYVWINNAESFEGIHRVTEIVSSTEFDYVIGEFGLDPVTSGTWMKLPLTWARADDDLAGKNMDDIDIGEVRELADVLDKAMRLTHGN